MRILQVIQCTNLGGMEQSVLLLAKGLKGRGHETRWVSLNPVGALGPLLEEAKVPCLGLPYRAPWGVMGIPAMRRAFQAEPHDAVIMSGPNYAAMLALGHAHGKRRVLTVHFHHLGVKPRWQWRAMYALVSRRFPVVTFPSDYIRREAVEIYPPLARISRINRAPIEVPVLPSPGDRLAARKRLGIPPDAKVIGNAGWLIPRKRFDIFLRIAARVAACLPGALFVIAGSGMEREPLERLAHELRLERNLRWVGWQSDLTDFYLSLDALLFNSDWDAMGRTPVEAVGYGIPVVASVVHGGLQEVLEPANHIFFAPNHDLDWLAEKLLFVLTHPEDACKMALAGREHLLRTMSVERHAKTIEECLG